MAEPVTPRSPLFRRAIGLVLACYWIGLFIGTHIPLRQLADLPKHSDKGLHLFAYAGLAYLLGICTWTRRPLTFRSYLFVFLVITVYAVFDELLQIPVGRHADVYDALADLLGGLIGLSALFLTRRLLQPARKGSE